MTGVAPQRVSKTLSDAGYTRSEVVGRGRTGGYLVTRLNGGSMAVVTLVLADEAGDWYEAPLELDAHRAWLATLEKDGYKAEIQAAGALRRMCRILVTGRKPD